MLVTVVKMVGTQRCIEVMHQADIGRVIQRGTFGNQAQVEKNALGALVSLFGQEDLMALFVECEITGFGDALSGARIGFTFLLEQQWNHLVDGNVQVGVVFGLAADDQGRARLVNQNRVHLVNNGVVQHPLYAITGLVDHVVTQVVEAEFVVRAVGDVGAVSRLLFLTGHVGQIDTHRQTQKVVKLAHPLGVAIGQVVVHRDDVDPQACQGVQINGHGGGQRLALTGSHLGNLAVVQRHAAQQLDIKMAHFHDALGAFAYHRKRFW